MQSTRTRRRAIAHWPCIRAYRGPARIGFARVVSGRATLAAYSPMSSWSAINARGIATRMVRRLLEHPELQCLRRGLLFAADAHALYRDRGFMPSSNPERGIEIVGRDPYGASKSL